MRRALLPSLLLLLLWPPLLLPLLPAPTLWRLCGACSSRKSGYPCPRGHGKGTQSKANACPGKVRYGVQLKQGIRSLKMKDSLWLGCVMPLLLGTCAAASSAHHGTRGGAHMLALLCFTVYCSPLCAVCLHLADHARPEVCAQVDQGSSCGSSTTGKFQVLLPGAVCGIWVALQGCHLVKYSGCCLHHLLLSTRSHFACMYPSCTYLAVISMCQEAWVVTSK